MGELFTKAHVAGKAAGEAIIPNPMSIGGFTVSEGICGMAYVGVRANTTEGRKLVNWCKTKNLGFKGYSMFQIPCHEFNQSFARKMAYCEAFAAVLQENGISATVIEWVN